MNWFDIVIIAVILLVTILGLKIGFVRALFLFAAFVLGSMVGAKISLIPVSFLEKIISNPDILRLVNFTAAFLVVFVGINVAGAIIYKLVSFTPLKWVDRWIGLGLGFLTGIIIVSIIITYLTKVPVSELKAGLQGSFLVPIIKTLTRWIFQEFPEGKSLVELHKLYICWLYVT